MKDTTPFLRPNFVNKLAVYALRVAKRTIRSYY